MLEGDGLVKVLGCHFKAFCFNNLHYFVWTTHSCFPLTSLSAEPGIPSPPHPDAVAPGMAVGGCVGGGAGPFFCAMTRQDMHWAGWGSHRMETSSPWYPSVL